MKSDVDGSMVKGKYRSKSEPKKRELRGISRLSEKTEADRLAFFVEVLNHDPQEIGIKLNFNNPQQVSQGGSNKDKLILKVVELSLFKSASGMSLDEASFEGEAGVITKSCPPIISKEDAENIISATEDAGSILNFFSSSNFVISLLMGGSMQQLFGMIRALQMIVLTALIRVPTPAHSFIFFAGCMLFASMDVLDGGGFYEDWFVFLETPPLNQNFELFGVGDMNFVMNSGSYFILGAGIFIFTISRFILNKIATKFAQYPFFRKVGMKFYRSSYKKEITHAQLKLFMESYFDLAMCAMLNFLSFYTNKNYTMGDYFGTFDDILCSMITLVYFVLIFVFPVWGYKLITENMDDLEKPEIKDKVEVFIDEVKTDTRHRALYNIYFLSRRLFTVIVLVFIPHLPFF